MFHWLMFQKHTKCFIEEIRSNSNFNVQNTFIIVVIIAGGPDSVLILLFNRYLHEY